MSSAFTLDDLLAYSDRDRDQWQSWFREHGPEVLAVGLGPNSTGPVRTVGELIRHVFSAEQRYVQRSLQVPLSDASAMNASDVEALFAFGRASRRALRDLLATFPAGEWDAPREFTFGGQRRTVTSRMMILQAVTHELRHWAQVATYLRQAGYEPGCHDVIC